MTRIRMNAIGDRTGQTNPIHIASSVATTCTWDSDPGIPTIAAGDHIMIVVRPGQANENIIKVTAHVAGTTVATIEQGKFSSTAGESISDAWIHGPIADDWGDEQFYNVVNYGADPTGTNDSYAAIMLAYAEAGSFGTVYFPKGTYKVSQTITVGDAKVSEAIITNVTANSITVGARTGVEYATGAGVLCIWTGSLVSIRVTYTSFNPATGVFSGCSSTTGAVNGNVAVQGVSSTVNGVTFKGTGVTAVSRDGFVAHAHQGTIIKWGGANNGGPVFDIVGPITNIKLQDIYVDATNAGGGRANTGIRVTALTGFRWDNVFVYGASNCYDFKGINGFYEGSDTYAINGLCGFGSLFSIGLCMPSISQAQGIVLQGDELGTTSTNSAGSGNAAYMTFYGVYIAAGDPGAGNSCNVFRFADCDDITIRDVILINSVPAGTIYVVLFDYNQAPSRGNPFGMCIDGLMMYGSGNFANYGTPNTPLWSINMIKNVRPSTAVSDPGLAGLTWQLTG